MRLQTNRKKPVKSLLIVMFWLISAFVFAQQGTIKGKVANAQGEPLVGASIVIEGTQIGAVSDIDGNFKITNAPVGEVTLVIKYVGYDDTKVKTVVTENQTTELSAVVEESAQKLDEVLVIGYGVQKKKLNTGANISVKGENIESMKTTSTIDALKGISPGVTITQKSGQAGSGTKVNIRGVGTIFKAEPLYIVDGIAVGDIDNLSPSDIESIDVLKDAASAAIYGSRAANGVILVTTKKGKAGKVSVTYDGYYGWQNVAKKPGILNAKQYAEIQDEGMVMDGKKPYNWNVYVPDWNKVQSGEWNGTNWFDEASNVDAPIQSHALNITGGSEKSIYAFGTSYLDALGIIGKQGNSTYKRLNLRLNSEHILWEKNGLNIVTFGENLTFTNTKKPTIRNGGVYWNDVRWMLTASPFLPVYDSAGNYHYALDGGARYADSIQAWNSNETNPIAMMDYNTRNNVNNNNSIFGNAYLVLQPIKNLKFRTSFGVNSYWNSSRNWIPKYDLSVNAITPRDQVNQQMNSGYTWTWTNTLDYSKSIGSHNISALIGQEAIKTESDLQINGHNENTFFQDAEHAYLDNTPEIDATTTWVTLGGHDKYGWGLLSYFGRLSYDYKETYLFTAIMRYDGSSMFDKGHKWGKFPSVSAGWVFTNESFMSSLSSILNYGKLRGSWGRNGNQQIYPFQYLSTLSTDQANYFFGTDKSIRTVGTYPPILPNPDIKWETSETWDIGTDMNFFNNKLQFNFDWYKKITKDWLVFAPQLETYGTSAPYINGGEITNKGYEIGLRWNDRIGELKYGINVSLAHNTNEVTDIANDEKIIHGPANLLSQGTSEMCRVQVGYPVGYFWGYETDGVMQDSAEVAAYVTPDGDPYFSRMKPGDLRFVDKNKDGEIDDLDKVMIGDPNPDYTFGFLINLDYKGVNFQIAANGQSGNQIAKSYRMFGDGPKNNFTDDVYQRWHGAGTSNKYPRLSSTPHRNTQNISTIYIENGDFLRIGTITLGYDFKQLMKKLPVGELRLYFTAKNIHTFTKYSGMDPEVGYAPEDENVPQNDYRWIKGVDLGLYPSAKSYLVGLSIKF